MRIEVQRKSRGYKPRLLTAFVNGYRQYQSGSLSSWDRVIASRRSDNFITFQKNGLDTTDSTSSWGGYSPQADSELVISIGGIYGASIIQGFNGYISEFMVFTAESDTLRDQIERYLLQKYNGPGYKVLFSNDTTNMMCSPYNTPDADVGDMLVGLVDETANLGVDVHILQPGFGWVPWWQSDVIPESEYWAWCQATWPGMYSDPWTDYIQQGGDLVQLFVDRCHQKGLDAFISYRLNDVHTHRPAPNTECGVKIRGSNYKCRFHYENPQYRRNSSDICSCPAPYCSSDRPQNWKYQAVRDYKFSLIEEICENYDIDGLELDFLRHYWFFSDDVSAGARKNIMTSFVSDVKDVLDLYTPYGQRRWLSVRVPKTIADHAALGIDLERFVNEAGVDMINISPSFLTTS